jgi:mono/diheme cytochrome c family protein
MWRSAGRRKDSAMKKIGIVVVVVAILLGIAGKWAYDNFTVQVPTYPAIGKVVWLEQNWTAQQREWFYHAEQGTQTFGIPYEWFIALEQPALSLGKPGMLSDPQYLDRYGFIPSAARAGEAPLPIGFATGPKLTDVNPRTNAPMTALGLTCAACHTGRFTYQGTTVLVDGAPALTNLSAFQKAMAFSLLYTKYFPGRFDRFSDRVLGADADSAAKTALRKQLDDVVTEVKAIAALEKKNEHQTVLEGFTRLDALNHIGNIVFSVDLKNEPANYVGYTAPVHFPRIWNASWFEWVQYNGSISQPMARNAGEALGVGAKLNLTDGTKPLYSSSVDLGELFGMEQLLAGTPPADASGFHGLTSPKWPDKLLPPISAELAAKGAVLYKEICQGCHLAPVSDPEFWNSDRWSAKNAAGERYLDLKMVDIQNVGTDPAQAQDMASRRVTTPASLGIESQEYGAALAAVVENTTKQWYGSQTPPTSADQQQKMNGYRPVGIRAPLQYKVRPLNGIWATPPYLHNGSVPTLYSLLSPVEERPKKFWLGNREYDPVNVGYRVDELDGGFEMDTTIRGNYNTGHEFSDESGKAGVVGRALTPSERKALIEYLKSL